MSEDTILEEKTPSPEEAHPVTEQPMEEPEIHEAEPVEKKAILSLSFKKQ